MVGRQEAPAQLFYDFDLERHVPSSHMLRDIDLFLNDDSPREALRPFNSQLGRPSIDPELIIRMLVIWYVMKRRASSPGSAAGPRRTRCRVTRVRKSRCFSRTSSASLV